MTACVSAHCMLLHYVKTLLLQDILRLPLSRLSVHTSVRSPAPVGGPAPPTGGGSFELLPRRPGQRRPVAKRSWELAEQEGAGALSLFLSFFLSFSLSLSLSLSLQSRPSHSSTSIIRILGRELRRSAAHSHFSCHHDNHPLAAGLVACRFATSILNWHHPHSWARVAEVSSPQPLQLSS